MKAEQTDFLDDLVEPDTESTPSAPVEPATSEAPPADTGQPRNPDGTFAKTPAEKAAAELVEKGGKPAAPLAPEPAPPAGHEEADLVPKSVVIALRKELQEAKAKLQPPAQSPAQPKTQSTPKSPEFTPPSQDQFQDRDEYYDAKLQTFAMRQSQHFAEQTYGADKVAEAWAAFDAACASDPAVSAWSHSPALHSHPHPIGEIVKWHKQQQDLRVLNEAGGLEKLLEQRLAAALQAQQPAQAVATAPARQPPPQVTPPPSLANGGAGAGADPEIPNEDAEFNGLFEEARKPRKR